MPPRWTARTPRNSRSAGRIFARRFGGDVVVGESVAGDVLASLTTTQRNAPSKAWAGGATMVDASLNRGETARLGYAVALARIGIVGLDGKIEREAPRPFRPPEAAQALLPGTPPLPIGAREFAAGVPFGLPSLAAGTVRLLDAAVAVAGATWPLRAVDPGSAEPDTFTPAAAKAAFAQRFSQP